MPITRLNAETELYDRQGGLLTAVGKTATPSGSTAAYNGGLREGLLSLGVVPAAFVVVDADLSGVADLQTPQVLDVAELRLLKSVLGWLKSPDQKVSLGEQKLGQFRADVATQVTALQEQDFRQQYGYGLGSVVAGRVDLNFAETEPWMTEPLPWDW